ncbi:hypothetical protein [Wenzhouxiangella marina]|uniref:hypothetical protein n=1 Tax=Wenzhouxiangella marina TaxID=1579979 RepID=UPI0012E17663|nr:hypothetical protein [Wenzhouxiangella marina]MBB6086746.1 hypothetical protein [Wenzhouxiangella marina]
MKILESLSSEAAKKKKKAIEREDAKTPRKRKVGFFLSWRASRLRVEMCLLFFAALLLRDLKVLDR